MKKSFIFLLFLLAATNSPIYSQSFCQNTNARPAASASEKYVYKQYRDQDGTEQNLRLAVVRPADGSGDKKRPLVIGVHSGGFLNFCPGQPCYEKYSRGFLSENFTPLGVTTASIEYRLTAPLDFQPPRIKDAKLREVHYKAVQDVREAVRYIFKNAEKLGVDTENVFLAGTSAGAITVLHAAFLDNEEVPKDLVAAYGRLAERENIKGVISFAGAIYDLAYLGGEGDKIPLMTVHGTDDFMVPIDKGFYFRLPHLTPVYGGRAVYEEALKKGIPAKGYFYDYGHSLPREFYAGVFKNVDDFIRTNAGCAAVRDKSSAAFE